MAVSRCNSGSARRSLASPKSADHGTLGSVGAARHHHVLRLQIAVDDLELVREMESFRDIAHQANGLREAEPASRVVRSESSSPLRYGMTTNTRPFSVSQPHDVADVRMGETHPKLASRRGRAIALASCDSVVDSTLRAYGSRVETSVARYTMDISALADPAHDLVSALQHLPNQVRVRERKRVGALPAVWLRGVTALSHGFGDVPSPISRAPSCVQKLASSA